MRLIPSRGEGMTNSTRYVNRRRWDEQNRRRKKCFNTKEEPIAREKESDVDEEEPITRRSKRLVNKGSANRTSSGEATPGCPSWHKSASKLVAAIHKPSMLKSARSLFANVKDESNRIKAGSRKRCILSPRQSILQNSEGLDRRRNLFTINLH